MNPDFESLPLRDIHLPDPVSWWPPAIGWWIVAGLLVLLVVLVFIVRAIRNKQKIKRAAIAEFNGIVAQYQQHQNPQLLINQLSILLRRLSVSTFPSDDVAGLTGKAWLEFLDNSFRQCNQKKPLQFCSDVGEQLITVPYRQQTSVDRDKLQALITMCQQWINEVSRHTSRAAALQGRA